MDANGTRFHLILGERDWLAGTDESGTPLSAAVTAPVAPCVSDPPGLGWNGPGQTLTLRPCSFEFTAPPADVPPRLEDRRGTARDMYGNAYWIASSRSEVRVKSSGSGHVSRFWAADGGTACPRPIGAGRFRVRPPDAPPSPPPPLALGGLAVTRDHYLVAGVMDTPGLLVFDLHAGGAPRTICWPKGVAFTPWDIAARDEGGVFVLDRAERRLWELDRRLEVLGPTATAPAGSGFTPLGTDPCPIVCLPAIALTIDAAAALDAEDPIAVEALADGTVLVLDRAPSQPDSQLLRYRDGTRIAQASLEALRGRAFDMALRPPAGATPVDQTHRIEFVDDEGNQGFSFRLAIDGDAITLTRIDEYLPMRLFGGKGLLAGGGLVFYDIEDDFIPLVPQRRPRYTRRGTVITTAFDGKESSCVWHRLLIDATMPPDTGVEVWSRAANEGADLAAAPWRKEPVPRRRTSGSERPYAEERDHECAGTWETLFQSARGRFLQLKIEVKGNGRATPRLAAVRLYYPRFSYLQRYLPAVYREEGGSASFLDRYLANVEGLFTSIEDRIAATQVLLDVLAAPAEALPWLATWFGVALDPAWDENKRRLFLRHAMQFFAWRGTMRGLTMALSLALCDDPDDSIFADAAAGRPRGLRIVERFRTRRRPAVAVGDPTELQGLRQGPLTTRWRPEEGGARLSERYAQFTGTPSAHFPLSPPAGPAAAQAWRDFSAFHLGFVPAGPRADAGLWQDFLARRYARVDALNAAHAALPALAGFDDARPFAALPPDGAPLADWYTFESVVVAMRDRAHQFRVLLPVRRADMTEPALRQKRMALVERVVELEKPAHTVFDVKLYWDLFRVGEARLQLDTIVHLGSRSPDLLRPLVLGDAHLAESYLAAAPPQDSAERLILGRDSLRMASGGI